MFDTLTSSFTAAIKKIRTFDDEKALTKALNELKKSLLKADVNHKVVKELIADVGEETRKNSIGKDQFLDALRTTLYKLLEVGGNRGFTFAPNPPTVILMTGLQGSGKTTTTGKLATYLKNKQKKVLIVAADLQRLAAVEQLRQISTQIEVELFEDEAIKNPVDVVASALKYANDKIYDVVLIDTAGRLAIDDELMNELDAVKKAANPDEIFYVADSMTGQDAVRTASTFKEKIGIDGVILSKYDGDAKGGVALGLASQVKVPLRFIGNGEKMEDLEVFLPDRIVNRLMGFGDIEGLAEKTANVIDEKQAKKLTSKIKKGKFNFNDFLEQMESMKKMGSMKSLMGMIPGMGNMGKALKDFDMHTHLQEFITIEKISKKFKLSQRTLRNYFQEELGVSPKQYLTAIRLNRVKDVLVGKKNNFINIEQTARRFGFNHLGQFSASYKKFFGELPSDTIHKHN